MPPNLYKLIALKKKNPHWSTQVLEIQGLERCNNKSAFKLLLVEKPWVEKKTCHVELSAFINSKDSFLISNYRRLEMSPEKIVNMMHFPR